MAGIALRKKAQKFSSSHTLELSVAAPRAKRRPSGDGTAQYKDTLHFAGVVVTLPLRSTFKSAEVSHPATARLILGLKAPAHRLLPSTDQSTPLIAAHPGTGMVRFDLSAIENI